MKVEDYMMIKDNNFKVGDELLWISYGDVLYRAEIIEVKGYLFDISVFGKTNNKIRRNWDFHSRYTEESEYGFILPRKRVKDTKIARKIYHDNIIDTIDGELLIKG